MSEYRSRQHISCVADSFDGRGASFPQKRCGRRSPALPVTSQTRCLLSPQRREFFLSWFDWIESARPTTNHYSIFNDGVYCGETFFEIDHEHDGSAALDIKLFKFARSRGIAAKALTFAAEEAFKNGAGKVWVDPNPENHKAIALYERLGFEQKPMPDYLCEEDDAPISLYMELLRK